MASSDYIYCGKPLSAYSLWELSAISTSIQDAEAKREEASRNFKFDKINNPKPLEFPPINPEFLKLKNAVEEEIKNRQGN